MLRFAIGVFALLAASSSIEASFAAPRPYPAARVTTAGSIPAPTAARMRVPNWNVGPSCRETANFALSDSQTAESCIADEAEARDELTKKWLSYVPAARARCAAEAGLGGDPSYVELLVCLDLDKELSNFNKQHKAAL